MEEGDKLEPRYPPVNIPRSEDRGDAMERVDARRSFLPSNRYIFPPISIYRYIFPPIDDLSFEREDELEKSPLGEGSILPTFPINRERRAESF